MGKDRTFKIGDCLVEQGLDKISRGSQEVTVRPQVMDVLVYLAMHSGKTVDAEELLDDLWPGKVVTSASIYNCMSEIRRAFRTCDAGGSYIETMPKRGYRLVAPVEKLEGEGPGGPRWPLTTSSVPRLAVSIAVLLSLALFTVAGRQCSAVDAPRLGPNSVVVLPFSSDMKEGRDMFSDGLMREILAEFGNIKAVTTIGRTTSMHYRNSDKPVTVIADELGVAAVLSGNLIGESGQLRLDLELLDGRTGEIMWNEAYELRRSVDGAFRVQSAIVREVAGALQVELSSSESARIDDRQPPSELAYEHYLRGRAYDERTRLREAIEEYELATLEDPYFADAWAALATAMADAAYMGVAPVTTQQAESALKHARQLAPNSPSTLLAEAMVLANASAFEEAVEKLNATIELQPDSVDAMIQLSGIYAVQLRLKEARSIAERAVMLDPLSIEAAWQACFIHSWSWSFEEARNYCDRALAFEPETPHSWRFWARYQVYLWGLGDTVSARQLLDEAPSTISTLNSEIEFAYIKRDWPKLRELLSHTEATSFVRHATEARLHRLAGNAVEQKASGELMRLTAENRVEALMRRGAMQADVESARSNVAVALALAGNESEAIRTIGIAVSGADVDPDRLNTVSVYVNEVLTFIFLGRNDTAVARLRALFSWARPPYLTVHRLRLDPDYDDLRGHPGFELLLEELGGES